MKYSNLSGIDIPVSNIIFGCCNPVLIEDRQGAENLLDLAYTSGFNIFDTAKVYGKSENTLGRWINNSGIRNKVVIITKGCHPSGDNNSESRVSVDFLREDIDSSLDRLKTDYIDIYLLHRDRPGEDMAPVMECLNDYMRLGIIKKIGVSNWKHDRIERINNTIREIGMETISVSSPQMSPAKQIKDPWGSGCVSITGDKDAEDWYKNHPEVVVFAYSCLAHGFLSGKISSKHPIKLYNSLDMAGRKGYWCIENIKRLRKMEKYARERQCSVSQISLSWCMNRGYKVFPIVTMSNAERIRENIGSLEISAGILSET